MLVALAVGATLTLPSSALAGRGVARGQSAARRDHTTALCAVASSVTGLTAIRPAPLNPETFGVAAYARATSIGAVRALAEVLCRLPVAPVGPLWCPSDFGVRYLLEFVEAPVAGRPTPQVRTVVVGATGCRFVVGLGAVRWALRNPELFSALGLALGVPGATVTTFAGRLLGG